MRRRLVKSWKTIRSYGLAWVVRRLYFEVLWRTGMLARRLPLRPWDRDELARWLKPGVPSDPAGYAAYWREKRPAFFFRPEERPAYQIALNGLLSPDERAQLLAAADGLRQGEFRYFSSQIGRLGFPPDWHGNPFTGQRTSHTAHWTHIPMHSRATGDLKYIWEPARFEAAYVLGRAYVTTGDETHAETFWQIVESWHAQNPPHHGAHWRCGQETSLRLMAWVFALYALADSPATTPERLALLVGMIAAQADRVARVHLYAWLQGNNHAISEGVGLWTVGLLFPELARAAAWREQGRRILTYEAARQIAPDGSYAQNSMNYERVMLQAYIWALRLGEVRGDRLPDSIYQRFRAAINFLYQLQDVQTGQLPCYGADDGALITPLNPRPYADFRPVIEAGFYLLDHTRVYAPGAWDEDLLWLFGPASLNGSATEPPRASFAAPAGGYYVLRGPSSFALTRCTTYRRRPAQADMLSLDLWWRHYNVAIDPGSYSYFADDPWDNSLNQTGVHNTLTVAGENQMEHGPRFLWFNWTRAQLLAFERTPDGQLECFAGQHLGYQRLSPPVIHQRAIVRLEDRLWVVIDDLIGPEGRTPAALHWLLFPGPHTLDASGQQLRLTLPVGDVWLGWQAWQVADLAADTSCGREEDAPRGWRATHYGVREPALSLRVVGQANLPARFVTVFSFEGEPAGLTLTADHLEIVGAGGARLSGTLNRPGESGSGAPALKEVTYRVDGQTTRLVLAEPV